MTGILVLAGLFAALLFGVDIAFALAGVGIAARTAWQAARATAVLDRALTHVTTAAGLIRLPMLPAAAPAPPPADTTASDTVH